ncbi:Serine/threonine-protein kinase [Sorochytrium milnesiophthora]
MNQMQGVTMLSTTQENPQLKHARGRLWLRVVEARSLQIRDPARSRPYCVVEYDKNEFVTKEAALVVQNSSGGAASAAGAVAAGQTAMQVDTPNPVWKHEATFDISRPDGEIAITIWDRCASSAGEAFLGMVRIRPPRLDGKLYDHWYRLLPRQYRETVQGELRVQFIFQEIAYKALSAADFDLLKVVGKGNFGKVLQVRKKDSGRVYAMKILNKKDIIARQEVAHTMSERNVLMQANSPFLVGLKFSFQTPDKLYLVLDYMNGGELFYHLQKEQVFSEIRAKFYTAELVLALEHLHRHGIVYRDLKPENVLLDSTGHVALTDFGLCKENLYDATTNTFCGTAEYLAPEVLTGVGYGKAVDWWSLGILLYEMTAGIPPFYSDNTNLMYNRILHSELVFPAGFSDAAKDLITRLLNRDATQRLGSGPTDAEELKSHPFFADVDWDKVRKKQIMPPFKPTVESEMDTSNFDPSFTAIVPSDSLPMSSTPLSATLQDHFKGFTYNGESQMMAGSIGSSVKYGTPLDRMME